MGARAMSAGASNASQLVGLPGSCRWRWCHWSVDRHRAAAGGCRRKGPHIAKPPDGLAESLRLVSSDMDRVGQRLRLA
jgi:hypothetical protein